MYVEDLLIQVYDSQNSSKFDEADNEFVLSISRQIKHGKVLSSRQAYAIRKVLAKYTNVCHLFVSTITPQQWDACLNGNLWRNEPRITVQKRNEARYLGDNLVGLSYQYQKDLAQEAQRLRAVWRNNIQILGINSGNVEPLIALLGEHKFEIDEALESYLALCLNSKGEMSHFIADDEAVVCNVCDSDTVSAFLLHIVGAQRI